MQHIYARGVYRIHLKIALPTPALSGSGSSGMISALDRAPHAKYSYFIHIPDRECGHDLHERSSTFQPALSRKA